MGEKDKDSIHGKFPLLPHISLGRFPTRVEKLEKAGERLGLHNLWVKRDDESGDLIGGNKVRKLELVLADAKSKGKETLIAVGAKGSNSVLATAVYANQVGLKTEALLFGQQMNKRASENFELIKQVASEIYLIPMKNVGNVGDLILKAAIKRKAAYFVAPGCSSPLGTIGYVRAAFELKGQIERGELPEPDFIFLPFGTGGTAVGLSLGAKLARLKSQIVAVRVVDKMFANFLSVRVLSAKVSRLLRKVGVSNQSGLDIDNLKILDGCLGDGYGVPTEEAQNAAEIMRSCEDIELDETYTAKAFAGLVKYAGKGSGIESQSLLFWNTFGPSTRLSSAKMRE